MLSYTPFVIKTRTAERYEVEMSSSQQVEIARWQRDGMLPRVLFRIREEKKLGLALCTMCGENRVKVLKDEEGSFEELAHENRKTEKSAVVVFVFELHCSECRIKEVGIESPVELDEERNRNIKEEKVKEDQVSSIDLVETVLGPVIVVKMLPTVEAICKCVHCKRKESGSITGIEALMEFIDEGYAEEKIVIEEQKVRLVIASKKLFWLV